jgi:DNA polymerase sigma
MYILITQRHISILSRLKCTDHFSLSFVPLLQLQQLQIPVIKFQTLNDLPVDISFDDGINYHSGMMTRDLINLFMNKFSELKPLALVLKQVLFN